ncbi:MAG: penicillin-binding protein 2, partial [Actinobacteria bacterium]|nr:penicillin-binding protein 2 [Actinomycetota bacterium]
MSPLRMAQGRLRISFFLVLIIFLSFFVRLVDVQAVNAQGRAQQAASELNQTVDLPAPRGEITDRNGNVLARSIDALDLVVDQNLIGDPKVTSKLVAPIINASTSAIQSRLTGTRKFVYVAKDITPAQWIKIKEVIALNNSGKPMSERIGGFFTQRGFKRDYPGKTLSANTLGFVNSEGVGGGGIEASMNSLLSGTDGVLTYASGKGPSIPSARQSLIPAKAGTNIRLTIDRDLQWITENAIASVAKSTRAQSITAVVMDPATGEILALATAPTFDPNKFNVTKSNLLQIPAVQEAYEPGSTGKVMTFAAALQEKVINPTTVFTIPYTIKRADRIFHDHESHPKWKLTSTGILAKSSNVGTIQIGEKMSDDTLYSYLTKFGIGQHVNMGLPGESPGIFSPVNKWSRSTAPTVAFGQGYSLTTIQATSVFATIANGGVRAAPHIVAGTSNQNGHYTPKINNSGIRVIDKEVATTLSLMMESVVAEGGTAPSAQIPGYRVAGKTGTASRFNDKCRCYSGYTASFIG